MKVLITGGAGYLGSSAAHVLNDSGHEVRVLDSMLQGEDGLRGMEGRGVEVIRGDVRSAEEVERALDGGVDAVVHLAAIVGDPACRRDPDLAREVNLDASMALLERAREHQVERFLFASTCSNYGRMADPNSYVTEESDLAPLSVYAETKVEVERRLLEMEGGGPAATVLRFATLFGMAPRMRFDLTVNEFTAELLLRGRLEVYGERFWRPYVHVRDAAEAIRTVLEAPVEQVRGRVYNVGDSSENYQKQQLVELIQERLADDLAIEYVTVAEDPRDYRVSFERIEQELGYGVKTRVPQGIDEVIAAISNGDIADPFDAKHRN